MHHLANSQNNKRNSNLLNMFFQQVNWKGKKPSISLYIPYLIEIHQNQVHCVSIRNYANGILT